MNGISQLFNRFVESVSRISFDALLITDLCAFGGIFLITLIVSLCSRKMRYADKRPYFHLLNAFAAITLALFATRYSAPVSIAAAAIFWCVGYLTYGLLCLISKPREKAAERVIRPVPVLTPQPAIKPAVPSPVAAPAAQSVVRLDHALTIADKLLLKTLGRGDRQELEKIKTSLTVLKVKGELSPQDGEALNEMFNALLKLMAKYDV